MFRCARTTCTEPRTDIVLLQMFAQRASEVTAVSQAVCGCLSFSKPLWDFSLFPDIKRALSSDCLGNPSCCLVTAADSTSAGMWFSCKRRRREADGLIPCCVFTQVREKPDHWHRGSNVCVCVCVRSGYGQTGPHAQSPGYDSIASAVSGMMHVTGPEVRLRPHMLSNVLILLSMNRFPCLYK